MEMENLHLPLDLLAEETFALCREFRSKEHRSTTGLSFSETMSSEEFNKHTSFPVSTGIIFKICESAGTYIIRAIESKDIRADFTLLENDFTNKKFAKLRLDDAQDIEQLKFFAVDTLEQAQVLKDHFSGLRLPLDEDVLCNISDPGFSWWLDLEQDSFNIYFKSLGVDRSANFFKLGPLCDLNIFKKRMNQVSARLSEFLEKDSALGLSIDERSMSVSISRERVNFDTDENNFQKEIFSEIKALIIDGNYEKSGRIVQLIKDDYTLSLFIREISIIRCFWIEIEQILTSNKQVQ